MAVGDMFRVGRTDYIVVSVSGGLLGAMIEAAGRTEDHEDNGDTGPSIGSGQHADLENDGLDLNPLGNRAGEMRRARTRTTTSAARRRSAGQILGHRRTSPMAIVAISGRATATATPKTMIPAGTRLTAASSTPAIWANTKIAPLGAIRAGLSAASRR